TSYCNGGFATGQASIGRSLDRFRSNGIRFGYSNINSFLTPIGIGYHNSISSGGQIREIARSLKTSPIDTITIGRIATGSGQGNRPSASPRTADIDDCGRNRNRIVLSDGNIEHTRTISGYAAIIPDIYLIIPGYANGSGIDH